MRIWLDPAKLNSFQMTTKDVTDAIESQNAQIAVGQLGGTPSVDKQALNATINAQSLLQTPQQFRDITLRVNQDGSEVKLGDVATVELGAEKYDYLSRFNGNPASVPAKLSRHAHSDDRRAGSINGHLLRALRVWLQY